MKVTGFNFRRICLLVILLGFLSACGDNGKVAVNDLTDRIEVLGNPYQSKYKDGAYVYARNIWDMQSYQGSIYLGAGNSSNNGPAQNAGPVPIIKFDPVTQKFIQEGVVDDEQIDVYHVVNGELYTPGHDPKESWKLGNFYHRDNNGVWVKYRNIPSAIHTYSLAGYKEKLFGSLNLNDDGAAVSISEDKGKTWTVTSIGRSRVYGFLDVANSLYAIKRFPSLIQWEDEMTIDEHELYNPVYEFKEPNSFIPRKDITPEIFFPNTKLNDNKTTKIVRPLTVGEKGVYIGAYTHNDHQFLPFGVYIATSLAKGHVQVDKIPIPDQFKAWDLLFKEGYLYILTSQQNGDGVNIKVLRSTVDDLLNLSEVLDFTAHTFARSFEILDNDFYFGLGSEVENSKQWRQEELKPETGQILRIRNVLLNKSSEK
ncbi:MAG: hypothetical protein EPN17_08790 [Methylobacter sp.]|nr:MAG: hypothetical protein EPN17_08790 [Methylobacter sp.]